MKKAVLLFGLAVQLFASCHSQPATEAKATSNQSSGFAVVELFTSQGCSSCPPADALLGQEIAAANHSGKKLIALSFHVDYWNRLGWTDPFSKHEFSQRQYGYSAKMKRDGVYTPQIVVNGKQETVGGNRGKIEGFINTALAEKPAAILTIAAIETKGTNLEISYQYNGSAADLNVAVVEEQISTAVKAGENDGRTLTDYNVVKSWKTIPTEGGTQKVEIETPVDYTAGKYAVVLYVQEKGYGKIIAADRK